MGDDPAAHAGSDDEGERIASLDERFGKLEAEQERQGGVLQQILDRLPGGKGKTSGPGTVPPGPDPAGGKSIAELVRDGVAELEAKKADDQRRADADTARADHAARIKALEERQPAETTGTSAGRVRSLMQRRFYGIDQPRK